MITLVYCATSGRIVDAISKTVAAGQFLYRDMEQTKQRLLEARWKIKERYKNVYL